MASGLTLKQQRFAAEYVKRNGNGTQAALAAGYANGDPDAAAARASENVRKRKVRTAINKLTRKFDISAERVLVRLDNLSVDAEEAGQYSASIKAEELIGKSLGMWIDRSETLNVNLTGEHLEALLARAQARRASARAVEVIDGQSLDATQSIETQDVVSDVEIDQPASDATDLTR